MSAKYRDVFYYYYSFIYSLPDTAALLAVEAEASTDDHWLIMSLILVKSVPGSVDGPLAS